MKKRIIERFLFADKRAVIEELRAQDDLNIEALKRMNLMFVLYCLIPLFFFYVLMLTGVFIKPVLIILAAIVLIVLPTPRSCANRIWDKFYKPYLFGTRAKGVVRKKSWGTLGDVILNVVNADTGVEKRIELQMRQSRKNIKKGNEVSYFECDGEYATRDDPHSMMAFCLKKSMLPE